MSTPLEIFGNTIRALRLSRGLSQEALADLCQLHRTYLGGIERGERNVSLKNILSIARALRIAPQELFSDFTLDVLDKVPDAFFTHATTLPEKDS